jgi:hypothetical protein
VIAGIAGSGVEESEISGEIDHDFRVVPLARVTREEVRLGGVTIPAGKPVPLDD